MATATIFLITACGTEIPPSVQKELANLPDKIDYNFHIKPILSDRCFACHGPDARLDLSDHLFHKKALPKRNLFWKYRKEKVIRQNQYKLLVNEKETLLYDLEKDLGEYHNLATEQLQLVSDLEKLLSEWEMEMNQVPQKTL